MSDEFEKILEGLKADESIYDYFQKNGSDIIFNFLKLSVRRFYKKGEIMTSLNDPCQDVGFVLKGAVRGYYIDPNGNDYTRHFFVENQFFLDEALVGYEQYICFYEALEDCEVLFINAKILKEFIMRDAELSRLYIRVLEKAIQYKIGRESSFLTKTATERYKDFREEYPLLEGRIKQSYIATSRC